MSSKSTTPRGLRETQMPPNHGDVWTYDEPSDLWKPKPGGGGVPSEFGIGAVTEVFGVVLANGVERSMPLDPSNAAQVFNYWMHGLTLNDTKDAFVVQRKGRYSISFSAIVPQHATAWMSIQGYVSQSLSEGFNVPAPPASIFTTSHPFGSSDYGEQEMDVGTEIYFYMRVTGADSTVTDAYCSLNFMSDATTI